MKARNRHCVILAFLLFAPLWVFASDPVPSDRLPYAGTWAGLVGVSGGIPNRTNIYTTLTSNATPAQISSAVATCASNSVVHLSAGTYNLGSSQMVFQKDGVTIRGDVDANGNPTTILLCGWIAITIGSSSGWDTSNTADWNTVSVISGYTRGSTNIVVASVPSGCTAGALLWLSSPTNSAVAGGSFALFLNTDPFVQIVKVTGVSGTTVSFYPAINADYLTSLHASTPAVGTVSHRIGLENLVLTGGSDEYVLVNGADGCWTKNCVFSNSPAAVPTRQLYLYTANRFEVRHCDFGTIAASGSDAYAIFGQDCTGTWVEDNYFHNAPNFYPELGAQNCVFSYNFATNVPYTQVVGWLSQIVYNHGCHNCYNLYEGNFVPTYYDDGLTNNVNDPVTTRCNTRLRDRLVGWDGSDGGKIYNCRAVTILHPGVNHVIAGCVLGKTGFTDEYEPATSSLTSMSTVIYAFDPGVQATVGLYGNWNAVDQGIHSTEALSVGQVIANSYLYSNAPSWFGSLTWPPIDPSRTSNAALSATNIPAGYRAVFGVDPPSVRGLAPASNLHVLSSGQ
jgi:hypothetical protein